MTTGRIGTHLARGLGAADQRYDDEIKDVVDRVVVDGSAVEEVVVAAQGGDQ